MVVKTAGVKDIKKVYKMLKQEHWKSNGLFSNKGEYRIVRVVFVTSCVNRLARLPREEWEKISESLCMEMFHRKSKTRLDWRERRFMNDFVVYRAKAAGYPYCPHVMSQFYKGADE